MQSLRLADKELVVITNNTLDIFKTRRDEFKNKLKKSK